VPRNRLPALGFEDKVTGMHHGKNGFTYSGSLALFTALCLSAITVSAPAQDAFASQPKPGATAAPAPQQTTTPAPAADDTTAPKPINLDAPPPPRTKRSSRSKAAATPAPAPVDPTPVAPAPAPAPIKAAEPAPAQTQAADATPLDSTATFGFYAGETRAQIIAAIGAAAVLKQDGDILEVNAAPKPNANFDNYLLIVGKKQGLVKLIATGKDIEDDPAGKQMKTQFLTYKTDLTKMYGDPSDTFDFVGAKSTLKGTNQFMMALTKTERTLAVYWTKKDFGNQITSVSVEGNGLGNDKGYLSMEYEFSGYHAYLLSK
jgi:hypothetical protein